MLSDLEIAQSAQLKPIREIGEEVGLAEEDLELYGKYVAKISHKVSEKLSNNPQAKYILVTGITPTMFGEGKTVTTIGLTQALKKLGKKAIATLRQPSMGPVFGLKGGGTGGGYSQVVPMEEINFHFTGDIHAVGYAHNLLSAMLDTHLQKGNQLGLDILSVFWSRVVDINDRALRRVIVGLGGRANGLPRETAFEITAASEVMSILGLSEDLPDLRYRLSKIIVGINSRREMITAEDLKAGGSMAVVLKKALNPNLVQTIEGAPAIIHTGPFGNISFGCSSVLGDKIALGLADYVITECGFGADCGAEKFIDIKCRQSGLKPDAAVLVATVRGIKAHGIPAKYNADRKYLERENLEALKRGVENLEKQIENVKLFGIPVIVAINRFPTDSKSELEFIREKASSAGAFACVETEVYENGGEGGIALAEEVVKVAQMENQFRFLYPDDMGIKEKIEKIAREVYGASSLSYSNLAERKIEMFTNWKLDKLPICIAKTCFSLSHDPRWRGRPRDFRFPIEDIRPAAGAGYLYPISGDISTMPGLPSFPAAMSIDIDKDGKTIGLI
jgi:formate--tetrahydrofolate ligase